MFPLKSLNLTIKVTLNSQQPSFIVIQDSVNTEEEGVLKTELKGVTLKLEILLQFLLGSGKWNQLYMILYYILILVALLTQEHHSRTSPKILWIPFISHE